ncbi:MAG TPA: endolytic transglycosylase MltG, partial [Solirubrobacteraceae bacterium]|nr:endolytic transglycosylase MltG [Solirubrobacteraceae bacterium]
LGGDDVGAAERAPIVPPAARRARSGRAAGDPAERPVPAKRVSAAERRLPPTPPLPGTPAFSTRRRRRGRILAFLVLVVLGAFLFGLNLLFQPFKGEGGETVTVRIPPNSTVADVGDVLADNQIVDSSLLFVVRARLAGADLKAGTYQLKKDSSYGDALDALGNDPATPRTIKVLVPEGRSRTETAPIVKEAGLAGSYTDASDTQKGFRPAKYGAPKNTKTLEGFLFPATYELTPGADATKLVKQQLAAFEQNVAEVDFKRAKRRNLSVYDVLIIASMVEREASLPKERPLIAAVIYNRLRAGEPLGIDATIRYAVRNWSQPLKRSELNIDSPYNTRRRAGLPPTPIGSPGLSSIKAAANPAKVDYKYYVVKPGGNGAHNFSSTIQDFERDVAAYNEARERLGGKSPAGDG